MFRNVGYSVDSHISCILVLWQTGVCQSSCAYSPVISQGWTMYSATVRQLSLLHHDSCRICPQSPADGSEGVKWRFSNVGMTLQGVTNMNVDQFISEKILP